ncbi:S41 family peptidase [Sphingomicrobium lutaoense]|uniref:Carboxyl-terminal processing protease n=1 Tax=Sphingomicrobium lutaoense TaxID=515949 RepID=A0A839Z6U1_9SPHN|nr:S41 family peptidase [Sphingomicrobium lutaoense]MBB3764464.1 carboxyl-terminal processing protease [Sphingomicrobium lutaoense]
MKKFAATFLPPLAVVGALSAVPMTSATLAAQDVDTYRELENFLSVFQQVRANYVEEVDDHTLIKGAIDGMLASLDPHSSYVEASDFNNMRLTTDGNYGGLGLTVSQRDGAVVVISPTEDTPAHRAGMKAGDFITHLDGELLFGLSLDEAVEKMRGRPGTETTLTVVRPGRDKPFDVTIKREVIELKPVKWEVKDGVGIININSFSAATGDGVEDAVRSIERSLGRKPIGYVVDLRSNPGGLLDQAVEVTDAFLERGEIVSERGRAKNDIDRWFAKKGDIAEGRPVIVLIDSGSASASEIVAGALQDHRRAVVMGERSFGKGSVQSVIQTGPKSALRLTTARYYTPSGRSVQAGGIEPDINVPQLSDPDYFDRPRLREADLRRHLVAQAGVEDEVLEDDGEAVDPRFSATAEELEKQGIEDYQLHYAVKTLQRVASLAPRVQQASGSN